MATAHAKSRLSNKVEARDADAAIDLIRFACFKKVLEKERKKRKTKSADSDAEEGEGEEEEEEEEIAESASTTTTTTQSQTATTRSQAAQKKNKRQLESSSDEEEEEEEAAVESTAADEPARKRTRRQTTTQSSSGGAGATPAIVTAEKLKEFKSLLFKLFNRDRAQSLQVGVIQDYVKGESDNFSDGDIRAALTTMQDDNQIMLSDDNVFLI